MPRVSALGAILPAEWPPDMPSSVGDTGKRIRQAYMEAGMNRNQFARAIGTNYSNVWRWETDAAEPSIESLAKASRVTGRSIDWLQHGDPSEPEDSDYPEFRQWLQTMAPPDLTPAEKATLASWRFQGAHPGPAFYATSLATWRAGVTAQDALRAVEHTEEIRRNRRERLERERKK